MLRTCASSVAYERRNLRRAGTLQKRSRTSTSVPGGQPAERTSARVPAFTSMRVPSSSSWRRVVSKKRETEAMDGTASPRKPSVSMLSISPTSRILLVAWRSSERMASSRDMPQPSSWTATSLRPPWEMVIFMDLAPASMAFSTSSLATDAGRSTTSPAAILFATCRGRTWICPSIAMWRAPRLCGGAGVGLEVI